MKNIQEEDGEAVEIAGAGPAGLAAAIRLAKSGRAVIVHEAKDVVGYRFSQDFQGLENWTTKKNVLAVLKEQGLTTDFSAMACSTGIAYDSRRREYRIHDKKPLFYIVERGPNPHSLDSALLEQAQNLGVDVRFNSRLKKIKKQGILAAGPKAADAIAVGYHFESDMENGYWAICDNELAPNGYAYLLVMNGFGTVKTCMFDNFSNQKKYVDRTVKAYKYLLGMKMINPKPHGGVGNFRVPETAYSGRHPLVGEQAGFQDTLWGFGMRLAISSGLFAADSLIENKDYDELWSHEMRAQMETSVVNREIFALMGNSGYSLMLRYLSNSNDLQGVLRKHYNTSLLKRLLYSWAKKRYHSQRNDTCCQNDSCDRVWCMEEN